MQKSMQGKVIGVLSAVKIYGRCKLVLKTYEKTQGVRPINQYTKKIMHIAGQGQKEEIRNGIKKVIMKNNENVVEEYYEGATKVMTCNYAVTQGPFHKSSSFKCTFDSEYTQKHSVYYFLKLALMHDFITDKTEEYINQIAPKDSQTLTQHKL